MGQVFTWDAIAHGNVPKIENFKQVIDELRGRLAEEPSIIVACLFGSVIRGDFTIRSDIDCLFVYETAQQHRAFAVMHELNRLAHSHFIEINFTPCDTIVAKTRLHHIGRSFVRHLDAALAAGGLIKGNLDGMFSPGAPMKEEIEWYIKMKLYTLQEGYAELPSFDPERRTRYLKKLLEAPLHVARKMLIYENTLNGDSKQAVREQYQVAMPCALSQLLERLLQVDYRYTQHVTGQLQALDSEGYCRMLLHLESKTPCVLNFLRSNIVRLDEARR